MSTHAPLGAIADDFTGATDLAGNWTARGLRTSVLLGLPPAGTEPELTEEDAVVVALKTRSIDPLAARAAVRPVAEFLAAQGCVQLYDKYCSTFDSTPEGNIGPIADVLLEVSAAPHAVVVPSFPDNGRTVYRGHLFVGDQLLHESPMRDHPLNPMRDSSVVRLLTPQTDHPVGLVTLDHVRRGPWALRRAIGTESARGRRLIVVDAIDNDDLATIARATQQDALVTGGSGLALGTPARSGQAHRISAAPGPRVVLSGSASAATQRQVADARTRLPHRQLDVASYLADPAEAVAELTAWVARQWQESADRPVLIYSVGTPADVDAARSLGPDVSQRIEAAFADLAAALSDAGARNLIVAGGETSGAVVERLGIARLRVGQALSPGVSWLEGEDRDGQRHTLVLKSGNFGTDDLFTGGWDDLDD